MLEISERANIAGAVDATVTLPFDARQKSRQRVTLSTGEPAALLLARGTVLRGGDLLRAADGRIVQVIAAEEELSVVRSLTQWSLVRAAYHLGNRHVNLEVGQGCLRYLHDHVLDHMVEELGLRVSVERGPFEPEAGAYGGHSHVHGNVHVHAHGNEDAHAHGHGHGGEDAHAHAHEHGDVHVHSQGDVHGQGRDA